VPPATIDAITGQLRAAFNRAPVRLTPTSADWSSITTGVVEAAVVAEVTSLVTLMRLVRTRSCADPGQL
jgi:hypothetical protein